MTLRCLIADDHPAVVGFLREYLESEGIEVTGTATDGDEALEKIEHQHPTVAVIDLRMPGLDGVELARRLARVAAETAVVVYTGYGDRALLADALDAGVRGFVQKDSPPADLKRAVETVAAGGTYVDPVLAGAVAAHPLPMLTQREREVLRLLADGCSNEEIGRRLFISPSTVRVHVGKAMRRLEAKTRTQAVATALREQLIR